MCAHYTVFSLEDMFEMRRIIDEVSKRFGKGAVQTGHIYPGHAAPILKQEGGRLCPAPAVWGFPRTQGKPLHNKRTDNGWDKPFFNEPLAKRRCVIPTTGYYEWAKFPKAEFFFRLPGQSMVYIAGIYSTFADQQGNRYEAFTMLTTDANDSTAKIHHRMPLVLLPEEQEEWVLNDKYVETVFARPCPALVAENQSDQVTIDGFGI